MENRISHNDYFFLQSSSESTRLIKEFDWASTSIGTPDQWSKSLQNTLALVLSSQFPMFLWWGEELIQFYNDAYRPSLGNNGKHPLAIGQRGEECWPEIWDFIYPLIQKVRTTGESVWYEDLLLPIYRNGKIEDVYWTFSYSAVWDDDGKINGVLVVCTETTDKIKTFKNLEESRNELEFAIDAASLGTWDLNLKTRKFTSNSRLKEWFGLQTNEEIELDLAIKIIAPKDRTRVLEAITSALSYESGGIYDIEYDIVHPQTKEIINVQAKGKAFFDENNQACRFNGIVEDITERKKATEAVTEARMLTDIAIKSVGLGLFKLNMANDEIEYTPEFAGILTGDSHNKSISRKSFVEHIHPDDDQMRIDAIKSGIETGEFYYTPRVIWNDGSMHRVAIMGAKTEDKYGNATVFSGTARDITIQENQKIALEEAEIRYSESKRNSEMLFRNVTDSSPTGLWLSDVDGNLTYINKQLIDWTGMPYEKLLGSGWSNAIIEEDRQKAKDAFSEAVNARLHYDVMFRLKKADDCIAWFRVAGDPYYDTYGNYAGYAGFCMDIDEIVTGRKALAESETLFRSIIEQAPVATCLFAGKEMKIEVANDIMISYWGKDRSVIGKALAVAVPELIGQPFLGILDQVYTTGIPYTDRGAEVKLELDGVIDTYYFDFTYKPLRNADGAIYGVMNMSIDVTKQLLAQQQIELNQKQLLASFEESPVAIAMIDKENLVFRMANPFYGLLVGRSPQELIGKPLLEALPEIKGQGFDHLIKEVIRTGVSYVANEVTVNILKNNNIETIYVDLTYQPRRDANEILTGVTVVATDVTQQVLARQNIQEARIALQGAIELAELATWKLDKKTGVFSYSKRFKKWMGFQNEISSIEEFYDVIPQEEKARIKEAIEKAFQPEFRGVYNTEHPIINQTTGQTRIVHSSARVSYDAQGNPEALSGMAQNVTKERKLKQELEFKVKERTRELQTANHTLEINNQELQQFAYIASHDLQEPVRKISIFMQMLESSFETISPKSQNYIDKIMTSAERMSNLIRDVLGFSQLSNDVYVFEDVDLNQIANEIVTEFELTIEQKNAVVNYSNLPIIKAIPLQMSQLFGNMISNSLKYCRPDINPEITITSTVLPEEEKSQFNINPEADYYKIEFRDNGIGFNQQYAEKIFNIFQRLHGKTDYAGTGIGLAMCKKIAQNHHGDISASGFLNEGAVFTIVLPSEQN